MVDKNKETKDQAEVEETEEQEAVQDAEETEESSEQEEAQAEATADDPSEEGSESSEDDDAEDEDEDDASEEASDEDSEPEDDSKDEEEDDEDHDQEVAAVAASMDVVAKQEAEEDELEEDSEPEDEDLDDSEDELAASTSYGDVDGLAAYFSSPDELLHAAELAFKKGFKQWDTFSPFPIHGMDDAMGMGRSWMPWVTFAAGGTGFLTANLLQFGTLTFDWPMIIGGKPHAPWPSFVPIMFELTVLIGGVTSALVMFIAAGCFRKPKIIDREITNDRFVLWVSAKDALFEEAEVFMKTLKPDDIKPIKFEA